MNKDIYIVILEYGREKGCAGTTYHDLYEHLCEKGYLSDYELEQFKIGQPDDDTLKEKYTQINRLFEESFTGFNTSNERHIRLMTMESYFKLIEYIEIVEARENAQSAKLFSLIAIALAAFTLIGSIIMAVIQSQQSLVINETQLNALTSQKYNDNNLIRKIEDITKNQFKSINIQNKIKNEVEIINNKIEIKNTPNKALNPDAQKTRAR